MRWHTVLGPQFNKSVYPLSYSMDLTSYNFGFFYKMIIKLKYQNFSLLEEIQVPALNIFTEAYLQKIFQKWKTRKTHWNCHIHTKGDCNEGDSSHKLGN